MAKKILALALTCMMVFVGACSSSGALGGTPSYKIFDTPNPETEDIGEIAFAHAVVSTQADSKGELLAITKAIKGKHPDADCVSLLFTTRDTDVPIKSIKLKDMTGTGQYFKTYQVAKEVLDLGEKYSAYDKQDIDKIMQEKNGYEIIVFH